jgi:hypothetical protein
MHKTIKPNAIGTTRSVSDGRISKPETLLIIAGLCIFSSLPWITGQILPEVLSPVVLLTVFLLAFWQISSAEGSCPTYRARDAMIRKLVVALMLVGHRRVAIIRVLSHLSSAAVSTPLLYHPPRGTRPGEDRGRDPAPEAGLASRLFRIVGR